MVGKTILHYKVTEQLGAGGMGVVYLADDTKLNRKVALKFLPMHVMHSAAERKRFKVEAQAAAALNHPNIASIFAIEETDDFIFIAMEYIQGRELKELIDQSSSKPSVSFEQVKKYIIQIAEGLKTAHSRGIIHRDIKSSNIMVTNDDQIKIMDFGLAKVVGEGDLTRVGSTLGTTGYMSPEQVKAEDVSPATDVWSLGVILCELISGTLPFTGAYEQAVFYSILNEAPPKLADIANTKVPDEIEHVFIKCLQKNPAERYQSLQELIDDITHSGKAATEKNTKLKKKTGKKLNIKNYVWTGIILVIAVSGLFIVLENSEKWFSTVPDEQHLAVLPFEMINGDSAKVAFCDGLVETMTSKLSQLEQFHGTLWVVPASEIRGNKIQSVRDAQTTFGVNLAVTGSLQLVGDMLRLTINLIDAQGLRQLNSSVIDLNVEKIGRLQDKSVIQLMRLIKLQLNPQSNKIITAGATTVPGAYEFYLQGLGYLQRYENSSNLETAIELFEQAVDLDSSYALAYAARGEAFWRLYDASREKKWVDMAIDASQKALELNSELPEVYNTLGLVYTGTGKYDEAIDAFSQVLLKAPKNAQALRGIASAYEADEQLDKAEEIYQKSIRIKPDYWAGYNALGVFYFKHGKYEKAIQQFRQVIRLTPDNARGYSNLGGVYYMTKRWPEAKEMFEKSLDIKKTYRVCSNLGTLYYIEEKYEDAAHMYEMALELNQADYRIWGNLASAYFRSDKHKQKAEAAYKKAIEVGEERQAVNPADADLLADLAGYYSMLGRREKAIDYINKANELAEENVNVIYTTGTIYEQLGERQKAINWLIRAIKKGFSQNEIESQPELKNLVTDPLYKSQIKNLN